MPSITVLVIDDEYGVRTGIEQILALEGYTVATAASGREAMDMLEARPYDIALIDYQLPDLDGLTLLASIRGRGLPTMTCMITAYANIDTAIAATRQGIDFFLPKPFSPEDLVGVVENLARHKQLKEEAEQLRRENEASLRALATEKSQTASLVASLRDAVLVVNREHEIVLANQAMAELLERAPAELVRQPVMTVLTAEPFSGLAEMLSAADESARRVAELSIGDRVFFASVGTFHGADGAALGRILTMADVTDLRRMAMEKPKFIRTMVHELRAPLGAIRSLLEVATTRSLGDALEAYLPFLGRANHRIDRLVEMIGELLSLSRIDLERTMGAREPPADAAAAVADTLELFRERCAERRISVTVVVPPGLPRPSMGEQGLKTVLGNLVGNAVKYGRDDGTLKVSVERCEGGLRIDVRDSGLGISAENLPRLCEEFFRERRPETRDIDGHGLGLAIVKRLVERAGGTIEVESTLGVGSTFQVTLPVAEPQPFQA